MFLKKNIFFLAKPGRVGNTHSPEWNGKVWEAHKKLRDLSSSLIAPSKKDVSPGASSSPRVKQPGCPPRGRSGKAS